METDRRPPVRTRRGTLRLSVLLTCSVLLACSPGGTADQELYEVYELMQVEVEDLGSQLDSTLIRIRDLENAIDAAKSELAGAESSAAEAQMIASRDPTSAEFHAVEARNRILRARSHLEAVRP